jgi:hypothetical protein
VLERFLEKNMDVNKWFLSLPPERQAVLREDKWMLANAAAEAAAEAEREACSDKVCRLARRLSGTAKSLARKCAILMRSNY